MKAAEIIALVEGKFGPRVKAKADFYMPVTAEEAKKAEAEGQPLESDPDTQKPAIKIAQDTILVLDPNNDYAQGAKPLVEDRVLILDQRGYREQYQREAVRWYNSAEELKIPYFDILRYPTNWPDLSALRERTTSQERGPSRWCARPRSTSPSTASTWCSSMTC